MLLPCGIVTWFDQWINHGISVIAIPESIFDELLRWDNPMWDGQWKHQEPSFVCIPCTASGNVKCPCSYYVALSHGYFSENITIGNRDVFMSKVEGQLRNEMRKPNVGCSLNPSWACSFVHRSNNLMWDAHWIHLEPVSLCIDLTTLCGMVGENIMSLLLCAFLALLLEMWNVHAPTMWHCHMVISMKISL